MNETLTPRIQVEYVTPTKAAQLADVRRFSAKSHANQFSELDIIFRQQKPIPWHLIKQYFTGDTAADVREYVESGWAHWIPKEEKEVFRRVFEKMRSPYVQQEPKGFHDLVMWIATSPEASDESKMAFARAMDNTRYSNTLPPRTLLALAVQTRKEWREYEKNPDYIPTFAPKILSTIFYTGAPVTYEQASDEARALSERSLFFNTMDGVYIQAYAVGDVLSVNDYPKTLQHYIRLYTLRRMLDGKAGGILLPKEESAAIIRQELEHVLSKFHRSEYEYKNPLWPTIGGELQYEGDDRVGISDWVDGRGVKIAKSILRETDMARVAEFAELAPSGDEYYEFVLPPSFSPGVQRLMFVELERIQQYLAVPNTPLEASVHINLGDVRFMLGKFEELQDMQFILLTCGLGFAQHEFSSNQKDVTWGYVDPAIWGSGYKNGTMVYERVCKQDEKDGRQAIGGRRNRFVSELRMYVIHSFSEGARLLQANFDLAVMAKAHQRVVQKKTVSPQEQALSSLWEEFREGANQIYSYNGLLMDEFALNAPHREWLGERIAVELQAGGGPIVDAMKEHVRVYRTKAKAILEA